MASGAQARHSPTAFVTSALRRALVLPLALTTLTGALILGLAEHVRGAVASESADERETDAVRSLYRHVVDDEMFLLHRGPSLPGDPNGPEIRGALAMLEGESQKHAEVARDLNALVASARAWAHDRERFGELAPAATTDARAQMDALRARLDSLLATLHERVDTDEIAVRRGFQGVLVLVSVLSVLLGLVVALYVRRDLAGVSRAFAAALDAARQTNRLKDEFVATLSHELRTPINAIMGWTTLSRRRRDDPAIVTRALDTIDRNARRQSRLIDQVLDMSSIVAGRLTLSPDTLDVASTLGSVIAHTQDAAHAKGIQISMATDHAGAVWGDPARVRQIMVNLVDNAVKFTPPGGNVVVGARQVGDSVELRVSDSGDGLSRDFLPNAFEPFRQEDASATRKHGGLGLGLTIAQRLVELQGGTVRVVSPGEAGGATFVVTLPCAQSRR
jgi:signal transduction histidine kinase